MLRKVEGWGAGVCVKPRWVAGSRSRYTSAMGRGYYFLIFGVNGGSGLVVGCRRVGVAFHQQYSVMLSKPKIISLPTIYVTVSTDFAPITELLGGAASKLATLIGKPQATRFTRDGRLLEVYM